MWQFHLALEFSCLIGHPLGELMGLFAIQIPLLYAQLLREQRGSEVGCLIAEEGRVALPDQTNSTETLSFRHHEKAGC